MQTGLPSLSDWVMVDLGASKLLTKTERSRDVVDWSAGI